MSAQIVGAQRLTKSLFLIGRQCRRRLWLRGQRISEPPIESDDFWAMLEAESAAVEETAAQLFPGAVRIVVAADEDDVNERAEGFGERLKKTKEALTTAPAILQAHLADGSLVAVADILQRRDSGWFIWEVKASTSLKPIFDWDLAFQVLVARRATLTVVGCGVLHLNSDYERADGPIDPDGLLAREDRTIEVESLMSATEDEVEAQLACLGSPNRPDVTPSSHCRASRAAKEGNRSSECGHLGRIGECGRLLPEYWAGRLPRLRGEKAQYVRNMADPDMRLLDPEDPALGWTGEQARAIRAARDGAPLIDHEALRGKLDALRWPVAYMDFEFDTGMGIPRFSGCRPYDRLPFQWSVLVQCGKDGELQELEPFLFDGCGDPRHGFLETLLDALPADGSIVVHEKTAEKTVLKQLADRLGGDLADRARELVPRLFDTKDLLQAGYYHPDQQGSYSIKKVAGPMLSRAYDDLAVQDGLAAVAAWKELLRAQSAGERESLRSDLLAYCGRDTMLMHEIVREVGRIVG